MVLAPFRETLIEAVGDQVVVVVTELAGAVQVGREAGGQQAAP
jgi:hypothetical protein